MIGQSAKAYRVVSTLGLALLSIVVAVWAAVQGLMQIGGLMAGGSGPLVSWLLISYSVLPLAGVVIAWWRWAMQRHAEAWFALVFIGIVSQFLVGSLFLR